MSNMYAGLRRDIEDEDARKRCADRLLALRQRLAPLKGRRNDSNLLLATWNIRDFDSNKFGFGPSLPRPSTTWRKSSRALTWWPCRR